MKLPDFNALRAGDAQAGDAQAGDAQGATCPSDFTLDQLHIDALIGAEQIRVEAHCAGCATCSARMAERSAGFDLFTEIDERAILARLQTERAAVGQTLGSRFKAWLVPIFAVAAAGAAAAIVLMRGPATTGPIGIDPEITRVKGEIALRVYRERAGVATEAQSGDIFQAGDRLMFEVDVNAKGHLTIYGVEPTGAIYTAWPQAEHAGQAVRDVGPAQRLPGAVSLDATTGREVLHAVLCPVDVGPPVCTAAPDAKDGIACPKRCDRGRFVMVKQ